MRPRSAVLAALLGLVLFASACGGDAPPPTCTGSACACDPGRACALDDSTCADDGCTLSCPLDASCSGACGAACSISCMGSSCDVTVGAAGSVSCTAGATCTVVCTGACSVSCSANSACRLQCAGGDAPSDVMATAQCT